MKFFKKALVASAILGSVTAAQAATVSTTPLKLSAEGVMFKVAPTARTLELKVVVDKDHPSASTITLTFDENVEFDDLDCDGTVVDSVSAGNAYCGEIGFNYGTGSYTFDNVVVTDGDATKGELDSISFEVGTGNPLYAGSSFDIIIGAHGYGGVPAPDPAIVISDAASVDFASVDAADVAIETGTSVIAETASQFGFVVTAALDGVIEREQQVNFITTADTLYNNDVFGYTLVNDESMVLSLEDVAVNVALSGNFKDVDTFDSNLASLGTLTYSGTPEIGTVTNVLAAGDIATGTYTETVTLGDGSTAVMPVTGDVTASAVVTAASNLGTGVTLPTGGHVIAQNVSAGDWELDATIINVPYFPVGYDMTSTSVHIANEGSTDADVIVTAIDNNGMEYGPLPLGFDLEGDTVTKVSQTAIMALFNITEATKLSVTFNIDADEENVSAYAFTQKEGQGRSEISNSQLKGK